MAYVSARTALAPLVGSLLACSGFAHPDLSALAKVREASSQIDDPGDRARLVVAGLLEPAVAVLGSKCSAGLHKSWIADDPASRATAFFEAVTEDCPTTCASSQWSLIASLDGREKQRKVLAACDAVGPDPVFAGPLAPLRPDMALSVYLTARMALVATLDATAGTDQQSAWKDEIPRLAVGLAAYGGTPPDATTGLAVHTSPNRTVAEATKALDGNGFAACRSDPTQRVAVRLVVDPKGKVVASQATDGVMGGDCTTSAASSVVLGPSPDGGYSVVDASFPPATP